ncbi:MAG: hypothetical protein HYX75_19330 [Acidobacteria bacterium]|nr:hypothetical protein [Acidobacteriota bacterium]
MNKTVSISALCCVIAVVATCRAAAQETEEVERLTDDVRPIPERPHRSPWEVSFEAAWLPGSGDSELGGTMGNVKAGFARGFNISPRFELSAGLHYSLFEIDASESARLPKSLHAFSVSLDGEYRTSERLILGISVSPRVSSDFKSFAASDVRVPMAFHANWQVSHSLSLLGGIAYSGQNRPSRVLPVIGVLYLPSERWAFALGFPRTGVIVKPNRKTELFVTGEFSGGEFRLHDSSLGASSISYWDRRAVAGADIQLSPFVQLGISGGYAFSKKFVFSEGSRSDVNLDGTPFVRLSTKLAW